MNRNLSHLPAAAVAGAAVVAAGVAGGVLAIATHLNTAAEAFSSKAELATPWPALLLQVAGVLAVLRWRDWRGITGASLIALTGLLALAALGDDETFKNGLPGWALAVQAVVIVVSVAAVIPCLAHIRAILRERRRTRLRSAVTEPSG